MSAIPQNRWGRKFLAYLIARCIKYSMKLVLLTCRYQIEGLENFRLAANGGRCILMLWHNRLAMVAEIMTKNAPQYRYVAMVSHHRDAEILISHTNSFKIGRAIRVPHDRKSQALRSMIKRLKEGSEVVIITPDGPKGPVYEMKPGIAFAARKADAKIVPFSWKADQVWRLGTWDRLMLPKPFTTIRATFGEPLSLVGEARQDTYVLENALNNLNHHAENRPGSN